MWTLTVVALIAIYESFKRIIGLFLERKLRGTMGLLFLSSLHSNYYAWWVTWNYWNDDFYDQWSHQLFFTITELVTTVSVLWFLDRRKPVAPLPMLIVANIALFHILTSSWDQFIRNVIFREGLLHQVLRDLLIMSSDLLYLSVSLYELRIHGRAKGETICAILFHKNNFGTVTFLTFLMFLSFVLFLR
jgi:hypothetical protein